MIEKEDAWKEYLHLRKRIRESENDREKQELIAEAIVLGLKYGLDPERCKREEAEARVKELEARVREMEAELDSHPDREKLIVGLRSEYKQALDDNHEFASMLRRERTRAEKAEARLEAVRDVLESSLDWGISSYNFDAAKSIRNSLIARSILATPTPGTTQSPDDGPACQDGATEDVQDHEVQGE